ncbi:hypothetical protein [Gillisia sp. CAL575]|uniref:hypothetical protein n=1 Tax=Gillisia sp. CAL575 TaxID=985255 RepID=UPI0003A54F71|nr:hypothetical protein [Gillisia sp. CAL575]
MRNIFLIFTLLVGFTSLGQNLNTYKYISVPEKFDFLKESNQYQMNQLTKFLFEKYGFNVFMENEIKPSDLSMSPCNVLKASILEDGGLFQTKLKVVLSNCANQEVFVSKEGISREKEYKKAFQEALRDAFLSFEEVNYSYDQNSVKSESVESNMQVKNGIQIPEEERLQKKEEVILTAIPQAVKEEILTAEKRVPANKEVNIYVSGDAEFYILNTEFGYQLFLKQIEEPFAKLIKTENSNYLIYSTIQSHGIAYFDNNENLVVEILNAQDNSTSIKTYKLKN